MKHAWTVDAARNNARWCNAVCFAHGKSGRFLEHMWVNAEAVPRFYPNAVTLSAADRDIDEQRQTVRILLKSHIPGRWAVKDSFHTLDIARLGFDVLSEANWIRKAHPRAAPATSGLAWARSSHPNIDLPAGLFSDANFAMFSAKRDGAVVAGGTFYRTESIVGLSNVVAEAADEVAVWHDLEAIAAREFPGVPLVGYESDDDLEAARKAGFEVGDPLRIWVKSRE
jgi:hypothetical protein